MCACQPATRTNLLGLGTTQGKFLLIASSKQPTVFAPREPWFYSFGHRETRETQFQFEPLGVSDEFNYSGWSGDCCAPEG